MLLCHTVTHRCSLPAPVSSCRSTFWVQNLRDRMMTDFSPNQDTKFLLGPSGQKKDTSEKPPTIGMCQQIPPASRITFVPGICAGASHSNSTAAVLNSTLNREGMRGARLPKIVVKRSRAVLAHVPVPEVAGREGGRPHGWQGVGPSHGRAGIQPPPRSALQQMPPSLHTRAGPGTESSRVQVHRGLSHRSQASGHGIRQGEGLQCG